MTVLRAFGKCKIVEETFVMPEKKFRARGTDERDVLINIKCGLDCSLEVLV